MAFAGLLAAQAHAQELQRLSAQWLRFNGTETASTTAATGTVTVPGTGGVRVYSSSVFVPFLSGGATLYVTIGAIGDNHGGQNNMISCNVDAPGGLPTAASQVCNPTPTTVGIDLAPPGWLTLTHHFDYNISQYVTNAGVISGCTPATCGDGGGGLGDMHDNAYYYTWCKPIFPGTHTINLRLGNMTGATSSSTFHEGTTVFFEKAFVYIDVSNQPPFGACSAAVIPTS